MDPLPSAPRKLHPLVATAAIAVIVVSVLGAIVLITDQVAAHRGPDAAVAAADSSASPAAAPSAPDTGAPAEKAIAPLPKPAHKTIHTAPGSKASAVAGTSSPPPPPAGVPAVPPDVAVAAPPLPPVCNDCGIVAGVRAVKTPGQGTGVGAVAGGVVGGVVGHQFGSGHGKDALSILGVIGGAVAGHEVEKEVKSTTRYEVDVRLDNGQLRTVSVPGNP
ncbi:MAG TPA: glycine zipper 2TM domain-containing protein, partial [Burkholderiaceae bacterium]|nr:glycine zipper 2TM domain-containing protein [Burkholderiaceae bacterium]